MADKQRRNLKMHPNLLMDVIKRQAGSVSKALLEAAMNSIDAGASTCEITLEAERFAIKDDGKGFQSQQEIDAYFETFGTPHQDGDATYGRFRMGRGQLMAFGRNVWTSNVFRMEVDIQTDGLDYHLTVAPEDQAVAGCSIEVELYEPLLPSDLERTLSDFKDMVAWAQIPVVVNGKTVSQRPEDAKWDVEDENAWIKLSQSKGTLDVYNLGVLVCRQPSFMFGTGGVVVSKKQLEVNFARNDIQRSCKVWKEISKHLQQRQTQENAKKTRLTDAERQHLAERVVAGEFQDDAALDLKIVTDVVGRHHRLQVLLDVAHRFQGQIAVVQRGDQLAEMAQKRNLCFALAQETVDRFGCADARELLTRIGHALDHHARFPRYREIRRYGKQLDRIVTIGREQLAEVIDDKHVLLKPAELKPAEKLILQALKRGNQHMAACLRRQDRVPHTAERKIYLGASDVALAWTDGSKMIAFDRRHAALAAKGLAGCYQVSLTLLHEYLHDRADTESHTHDFEFYEAFHDLAGDPELDPVGKCAKAMAKSMANQMRSENRKLSQAFLEQEDVEATAERLGGRLDLPDDAEIEAQAEAARLV